MVGECVAYQLLKGAAQPSSVRAYLSPIQKRHPAAGCANPCSSGIAADALAGFADAWLDGVKADHAERIYRLMTVITRPERKVDALNSGQPDPPLVAPATPAARLPLAAGRAASAPSVRAVGGCQSPVPGFVRCVPEGGSGPVPRAPSRW